MTGLPSPAGGSLLEVSFRRLLASCEDIVAGTSLARPDLIGCWQHSPVFHAYVETLQEQLSDLEASAGSRVPRQLLQRYGEHVEALAARLMVPELPAYCAAPRQPPALQQQQQPGSAAAAATPQPVAAPRPAAATPPVALMPPLPPRANTAAQPAAQPAQPPAAKAGVGEGESQDRLHTQQQLHEDLTEELAGLAAALKASTQAVEGRLRERGQLLEGAEAALDTSLQHTKASKERATAVHKKGRANLCLTCLVMLVVGLLFAGMYAFIKLTRLAGYRAAVPAAAPPPLEAPAAAADVPQYEQHYEL